MESTSGSLLFFWQNESECIDHVNKRNHRPFITSVPVCGYMCPQCLTTLADMNTCQEHIETLHHFDITYSFQGNATPVLLCVLKANSDLKSDKRLILDVA